jgi:hypothetical protein
LESIAQNIVALALAAVLVLALGGVFWKLLVVCFALLGAAFRYSVIAVLLVVIAAYLGS